jgi:hypothetical protein
VNHPLEPRSELANLGAALERPPGIEKPILKCVLGEVAGQDPPATGDHPRSVAPDEYLECAFVAATSELGQPFVCLP